MKQILDVSDQLITKHNTLEYRNKFEKRTVIVRINVHSYIYAHSATTNNNYNDINIGNKKCRTLPYII